IEMAEHLIQKSLNHPLLQQIINHSLPDMDQVSIHWGLAGILFTLLLIYNKTDNEKWLDHACQLGNILTQHIPEKTSYVDKANPGFGYGASGVAFSLLLLARISGQQSLSKFAKHWLDLDISCIQVIQPELGVYGFRDELNVGESYFEIGTAGFVSVVLRFWKYFDEDREMMRLIEWVELDLFRKYSVLGGYLWGLSGVLETLYDLYHYTQKDKYHKISKSILQGLFDVHIFTPEMKLSSEKPHIQGKCTGGLGLWRVSTDLATGSAGVLYVLSRISKKGHSLFFRDSLLYP
ncbi:MAG: hypothetical protein L3J76_05510, partial [Candidatus Hydrothermae bacterium]|nr:hypothetical protein [Candidatus Hydrothermae bacterium]